MGGYFCLTVAFFLAFFCLIQQNISAELFQDLGLNPLPDITKINVSLDEYTRMMTIYLNNKQQSSSSQSVPKLINFFLDFRDERNLWLWWRKNNRLKFTINSYDSNVDSAQLKILFAPITYKNDIILTTIGDIVKEKIKVYQILGVRRKRLIDERTIYLSRTSTKWCDFDITSVVKNWLNGERNLGLQFECNYNCKHLEPLQSAISALVYSEQKHLVKRSLLSISSSSLLSSSSLSSISSASSISSSSLLSPLSSSPYQPHRRTDCRESNRKGSKRKCCRHNMNVRFSELKFPEMGSIIQPKSYEAGYCQGQCPPNYNHATNHSRIQSIIHQMDRKKRNRRAIPKACCAPSKLEPLEILRVNPADETKLIVEKWDNMQVIECACS